jgi:hypothetical protein
MSGCTYIPNPTKLRTLKGVLRGLRKLCARGGADVLVRLQCPSGAVCDVLEDTASELLGKLTDESSDCLINEVGIAGCRDMTLRAVRPCDEIGECVPHLCYNHCDEPPEPPELEVTCPACGSVIGPDESECGNPHCPSNSPLDDHEINDPDISREIKAQMGIRG